MDVIKLQGKLRFKGFFFKMFFFTFQFCFLFFFHLHFISRLIQYACRGLWDSMQTRPWNAELIDKLKTLEYLLSSFRKCKFILSDDDMTINWI